MFMIEKRAILFDYSELNQKAKERAKAYYMENFLKDWQETTIDSFVNIASVLGITFKYKNDVPMFYFSLEQNSSGTCFFGYYDYNPDAVDIVRKEYPNNRELENIAIMLDNARKETIDPVKLEISCDDRVNMKFDTDTTNRVVSVKAEKMVIEAIEYLCEWFYKILDNRYLEVTSESYISDIFLHNDIKFLVNGTLLDY